MMFQKEPSNHEKQLVALGRTLQSLREEDTVEGAVKVALNYLQAETNYALVWLGLYDRVAHCLIGQGGVSPNGETALLKQRVLLNPGDLLEQLVIQQRPLGIPDLREESRAGEWSKIAQRLQVQGTLFLPIRYKDRCFGVVLLGAMLWGNTPYSEEKSRLSMILGGLAEALYQLEMEQQRRQAKHPEDPLLSLLTKLRSLNNLTQRLAAIIEETQQFIAPSRTNIYWYEPQKRYFWRRVGNLNKTTAFPEDSEIPVQELGGFYQALAADQVVSIGEARSTLKADIAGRLMQQIQARSLIAAPILYQGELLGFLAVEGREARIWLEEEKKYVRGAAQLAALVAPLESMDATIQQVKQDQALTAEIAHALHSEVDWKTTLRFCGDRLFQRLKADRFLVLLYNADLKKFEICYQQQSPQHRSIPTALDHLNPVDWQMLERSTEAIGIENLETDLKFMAWRQLFLDLEVRSLLVCNTSLGKPIEGLIVIGHDTARSWHRAERELVKVVSQQIGLLLHQFQLQTQTEQLQKNYQVIQWGLTTLQQLQQLDQLERSAVQHIAQLLQAQLVTLITWQPGQNTAQITAPLFSPPFKVATEAVVDLSDELLQLALQHKDLQLIKANAIATQTRQWLTGTEIGQVLVYALRTAPEHEPTGILLIGDRTERVWLQHQLSAFGILANQLAWCRRSLQLSKVLFEQRQTLEQLNWYKHRRLEEIYRILNVGVRRLNELSHQKDGLSSMRYHQVLRHLSNMLTTTTPLIQQEQWQLQAPQEIMPLASLLKRSLERLDALIKQRQLWSQVHSEANLSISGNLPQIELIVHELLMSACLRSPLGGRLDIWCRPIDAQWMELSITESGTIELDLIEQMELGRAGDLLTVSLLDHPPGLHLFICQTLMRQMGGELTLEQLEDGRSLSRLILPLATGPSAQSRSEQEISGFF